MAVVTVLLKGLECFSSNHSLLASAWSSSWLWNTGSSSHTNFFLCFMALPRSPVTQTSIVVRISKSRVLISHRTELNSFEDLVLISKTEIILITWKGWYPELCFRIYHVHSLRFCKMLGRALITLSCNPGWLFFSIWLGVNSTSGYLKYLKLKFQERYFC